MYPPETLEEVSTPTDLESPVEDEVHVCLSQLLLRSLQH